MINRKDRQHKNLYIVIMRKLLLLASFLVVAFISAMAQSTTITGTVTGEDGLPIPGAAVMVKGTTSGTVTDMDGKYTINAPADAEALIFRFVGMVDQEQSISGRTVINAALESDWEEIDEVVVVAYGSAKRGSLTGAVTRVGSDKIEQSIGTSVTGALEGAAPGVQVNNTYGEPGAAPTIRIRGLGSVNGSNAPLVVVDGVPYNGSIADINSNDIESMTVLKDASSAALYGSRAANGVILINTKGASGGKSIVTFTANFGLFTRGIKEYERLGADDWMKVQWTGMKNSVLSDEELTNDPDVAAAYATEHLIGDLVNRNIYNADDNKLFDAEGNLVASVLPGYTDLDWVDAVEQTGHRQQYGMSYQSNNEKYTLFASFDYMDEEGYIINTEFKRFSGRVNSTISPKKWCKLGVNLAGSQAKRNYNSSAYGTYYANPFYITRQMAPVYPIYLHNADGSFALDDNGNIQYDLTSSYLKNRHIIYERKTDKQEIERYNLDGTVFATAYLPFDIDVTVKANENIINSSTSRFNNSNIGDGAANNGRMVETRTRTQTINFQQLINWSHEFDVHHVDALLAHESYKYSYRYLTGMNTDQMVDGLTVISNFSTNSYLYGADDEETIESYLARARYNYDEKYFLDASFRTDGSSRFDESNRWGQFFSVGGAWDITREDFISGNDYVDFLKLRASFGQVGNNKVLNGTDDNYYASQALYALDKNASSAALFVQQLSAKDVKWETTQTVDIAIESRLFSRLNLNVGYFDKTSKDLLFQVKLPGSVGAAIGNDEENLTQLKNIGRVKNSGWELSADIDILQNDIKWNVGADATFIKNKIKKLPNGEDIANGSLRRYSEGHSMFEFYTYHFEGVDQLTGKSLYEIDDDKIATAEKQGELVEINGKQYTTDVNYGKRDWRGNAMPKVYGAMHTTLSWKGLALNVLATYQLGGKVFDSGYRSLMQTSASSASAQHKDILKSWSGAPEGMTETSSNRIKKNGIPIIDHNRTDKNNDSSADRWLISANYLVLKNVNLTYSLPGSIVSKLDLESITFNAGVENAFTLTKRQGLNPQYGFNGAQDATYTTARLFNVGATIKF